jgi:hypothetical protein
MERQYSGTEDGVLGGFCDDRATCRMLGMRCIGQLIPITVLGCTPFHTLRSLSRLLAKPNRMPAVCTSGPFSQFKYHGPIILVSVQSCCPFHESLISFSSLASAHHSGLCVVHLTLHGVLLATVYMCDAKAALTFLRYQNGLVFAEPTLAT